MFQSIGGTEKTNNSFGISLSLLREAYEAGLSLKRGTVGNNFMYFETGQGSSLSANAHEGVDQQTCEARAYAVARHFKPLLVNSVVGFIGPEYLFDGKQIIRAALEDHQLPVVGHTAYYLPLCHPFESVRRAVVDELKVCLEAFGTLGGPDAAGTLAEMATRALKGAWFHKWIKDLRMRPEEYGALVHANLTDPKPSPIPQAAAALHKMARTTSDPAVAAGLVEAAVKLKDEAGELHRR